MGNRLPGGCVFGERSKPKTEGAENVLIYQIAQHFWGSVKNFFVHLPPRGGRHARVPVRFRFAAI
ncbi:MAG: hypothetical protein LBQ66_08535 [Planctomycetaceae bacterium]|nr:hypothetical protein [Planctomycetaceae bacterium]